MVPQLKIKMKTSFVSVFSERGKYWNQKIKRSSLPEGPCCVLLNFGAKELCCTKAPSPRPACLSLMTTKGICSSCLPCPILWWEPTFLLEFPSAPCWQGFATQHRLASNLQLSSCLIPLAQGITNMSAMYTVPSYILNRKMFISLESIVKWLFLYFLIVILFPLSRVW